MQTLNAEIENENKMNTELYLKLKELSKLKLDYKMLMDDLAVSDERFLMKKDNNSCQCNYTQTSLSFGLVRFSLAISDLT